MPSFLPPDLWPLLATLAHVTAATAVTVDAVLRKRHVQSVIGWVGVAWLAPFAGALAYLALGVNRIRRAAPALTPAPPPEDAVRNGTSGASITGIDAGLVSLERLGAAVTGHPLSAGNRIEPLVDGDEAFPAMLAAIDGARHSITLATYIFDTDEVGHLFSEALDRAARRGVAVRVLIDDVGARYARPTMARSLRRLGVPTRTFLPTRIPRVLRYANLRNHRKLLVVDGRTAFTGGMNLRAGHWLGRQPHRPVRCLHFRVEGPVVDDLQRTFAIDWQFTTGERLAGEPWFADHDRPGTVLARGIADGPDEDLGKMPAMLLGALTAARHRVSIVTPYFLPDDVLLRTLQITAMRGVEVTIVVPEQTNVRLVDWAMRPQLPYLLRSGCRIWLSPLPFDHTKLFCIDGSWSLIGSTNWDARSLRLNFEYNLECYDRPLATRLEALVHERLSGARRLQPADCVLPLPVRLRNGLARLLSPYL